MPIEKLLRLVLFAAIAGCATFDQIETSANAATLPAFRTFRVYQQQYAFAHTAMVVRLPRATHN
jgi:hypothetical protein